MVFSSHIFLFYFLPLALLLYYASPRALKHLMLTHQSLNGLLGEMTVFSTHLQQLHLSGNNLNQVTSLARFLKATKSLEVLKLRFANLGEKELRHLGLGMKTNMSIVKLDLRHNHLSAANLIADILLCNIGIEILDMGFNSIDDEGLVTICGALEGNNALKELAIQENLY